MTVQINITVTSEDGEGQFTRYESSILAALGGAGYGGDITPVPAPEAVKESGEERIAKVEAEEAAALDAGQAPKRKRRTRAEIEAEKKLADEVKELATKDELKEAEAVDAEEEAEEAEEAPAEPEADEPQEDEEQDAEEDEESDGGPSLDDAIAETTKLVAARKQAVVKAALKDLGVKRVTELDPSQVAAYLKAVGA